MVWVTQKWRLVGRNFKESWSNIVLAKGNNNQESSKNIDDMQQQFSKMIRIGWKGGWVFFRFKCDSMIQWFTAHLGSNLLTFTMQGKFQILTEPNANVVTVFLDHYISFNPTKSDQCNKRTNAINEQKTENVMIWRQQCPLKMHGGSIIKAV